VNGYFPSMSETFGNVTLEAMASGLAVVAYDYAAARAHIEHGRSGVLAPSGRDDEFVARARKLAANPADVRRLGRAARAAAERLGWDRICEDFERVLVAAMLADRAARQARRRLPS
jgi:glycosyltransferase involved in cell wall biosynthesis